MSDIAIHVDNLGKQYHIGQPAPERNLRETITNIVTAPFRRRRPATPVGDTIWALKEVSFEVKHGEVVGIIGRNGSGKSTLLKILSRITEPTVGRAELHGRVGSLLEVGTGFHPELTGRENIYMNGAILGMRRAEIQQKFDEIVAFSEIEQFLDTPVKRYSSGMYVRLAFAVAAHLEPEILLVDEVLAVGDAAFQKKCLGKMNEVARGGRTVLFVSHNMQTIRALCSRSVLFNRGRLEATGASDEVIRQYLANLFHHVGEIDLNAMVAECPSDPTIRISKLEISQESHPVTQFLMNGLPLEITVDFEVRQPATGLRIFCDLCDVTDGTILFRTFHDEDNDGIPTMLPGHYRTQAVIPADLLAPCDYTLLLNATIFNQRVCFPESSLRIPLHVERTGRANRAYQTEPIRGRLAPFIPWHTRRMDQEAQPTPP